MNIPEIITILSPVLQKYLGKAAEEFSGEVGKSLWKGIKNLFKKPEEQEVLRQFEQLPAASANEHDFLPLLQNKLDSSPDTIEQLKSLIVSGDHSITVQQFGEKSVSIRDNLGNINIS